MSDLKDENGNLLPDGKRLTPLGNLLRTLSLDELPQLINILKGEMSFIGPRALFAEYKTLYSEKERLRHTVRPGITGWAQVNGRNSMSWKDRFLYDIYYVENQSWIFDLKIACLTIGAIIRREGINQSEGVTKEKYNGSN
jgi:undecaprenyl phosphate N,N'-diacetylbacillosamine 1-phosphate transferase